MNANPAADIFLVHGGFVDGSGWRAVCDLLTRDGYHLAVAQNPHLVAAGRHRRGAADRPESSPPKLIDEYL